MTNQSLAILSRLQGEISAKKDSLCCKQLYDWLAKPRQEIKTLSSIKFKELPLNFTKSTHSTLQTYKIYVGR